LQALPQREPEDVFAWQQTVLDNEGEYNDGIAPFYASTNEVGRSDIGINPDFLYSIYDSTDGRGMIQEEVYLASKINKLYYVGFGQDAYGDIYCAKWLSHKLNINMVRLAEMYLTRAEANQMIIDDGGTVDVQPIDDINIIRERAGIDTRGMNNTNIDEIRLERYKELIFEGHRLHDYKRWKRSLWTSRGDEIIVLPYDAEELIIPIPKKETDANLNL